MITGYDSWKTKSKEDDQRYKNRMEFEEEMNDEEIDEDTEDEGFAE